MQNQLSFGSRVRLTTVLAIVLALATACGEPTASQPTPTAEPGTVMAGAALYTARGCQTCHGVNLEGGKGPKLVGEDSITGFTSTVQLYDYVHRSMPQFAPGTLSEQDVYSLIAFMLDQNELNRAHIAVNAQTLPAVSLKP